MTRHAPPGTLVASGRLRVDAARAVAKLRAFRLADSRAWILEAVRAAVASGATELELLADSDDLTLRWAGPPWPAEALPALLDELVSPEEARGYHRRLLGSAVNSALGLAPRWLELCAAEPGGARGVRFRPEDLEGTGPSGEPVLHAPPLLALAAPPALASGAPCAVSLALRYPSGPRTWWRALVGDELPELAVVRAACAELAVPLTINGAALPPSPDLVRLPLGDDVDGFVALISPPAVDLSLDAELRVAELGVAVTTLAWPGARLTTTRWLGGGSPPVRLWVSAPRLVTNAARSAIDEQTPLVSTAKERGERLLVALLDRLAETLAGASELDPRLRDCALALLAASIAGARWSIAAAELSGPLAGLARVPLVCNAVGELRPVAAPWARPVYRGKRPLPRALAPWLSLLPWIPPGDTTERLLDGADPHSHAAGELVQQAKRARKAHDRFFAQPPRQARVAPGHDAAITFSIDARADAAPPSAIPQEAFAGLAGEVSLHLAWDTARLALWHHGRLLETLMLMDTLPFDAAIDSQVLTPDLRCRAAERDAAFDAIVRSARLGAVRAVELWCAALAAGRLGERAAGVDTASLVRRAVTTLASHAVAVPCGTPLATAPAWPTEDGQRLSIDELRAYPVVVTFPLEQARFVPPRGRVALRLAFSEVSGLAAALAPGTAVVSYGPFVSAPPSDVAAEVARRHLGWSPWVTLVVRQADRVGAISSAEEGEVSLLHRGVVLAKETRTCAYLPCQISIDCEALVPGPSWREVVGGAEVALARLDAWELALIDAVVRTLLGEEVPDLWSHAEASTPTLHALAMTLLPIPIDRLDGIVGAVRVDRLRQRPLFDVTGQPAPVSARQLAAWFPSGTIYTLTYRQASEGVPEGRFLIVDEALEHLARWLTRLILVPGAQHVVRMRREAVQALRLSTHLLTPAQPMALPADALAIPFRTPIGQGFLGAAAPSRQRRLQLQAWHRGRPVVEISIPMPLRVAAVLDIDLHHFDEGWSNLHEAARCEVVAAAREHVEPWLRNVVESHAMAVLDNPKALALLEDVLRQRGARHASGPRLPGLPLDPFELLRAAPIWPDVCGGHLSLQQAARAGSVRVSRWRGPWLPAREGALPHPLDVGVISLPEEVQQAERWLELIESLSDGAPCDVTAATMLLQSARRAEQQGAAHMAAQRSLLDEPPLVGPPPTPVLPRAWRGPLGAGRSALRDAGLLGEPPDADEGAKVDLSLGRLLSLETAPVKPPSIPPLPKRPVPPSVYFETAGAAASVLTPPSHPLQPLAVALASRLRELCGRVLAFASFVIVDDRTTPMVVIADDRVELGGKSRELADVAALWARDAAAAEPAVVGLLAYLATELNRAHTAVTDVHEQRILLELLRQRRAA